VVAIGSGGNFALVAAKALLKFSDLSAKEIAEESLQSASGICIYANSSIIMEEI